MEEILISVLFILFMFYIGRFIKSKVENPNQPNGEFYFQSYINELKKI
jgi:hypothetical protein